MVDVTRVPNITIASTPPNDPELGDLWWSPVTGQQSCWYNDGNTIQWVISNWGTGKQGPPGLPGSVYVDDFPPMNPANGTLWWSTELGVLFIWYDDGTSAQWVATGGGGGGSGSSVYVGDTPPASVLPKTLWWNSALGALYIYYDDGNTTQWVPATPSSAGTSNVTDVKQFGATGDGVTDDTVAIQAAIDYVGESGGGTVFFPAGTYIIHNAAPGTGDLYAALRLNWDKVVLEGAGDASLLKCQATAGDYGAIQMRLTPLVNGVKNVERSGIRKMKIDGSYTGARDDGQPLVGTAGLVDCFFENVYFKDGSHYLLGMQNGGHVGTVVKDCWFDGNPRDAIDVKNNTSGGVSSGKGLQFLGCHFKNNCRGNLAENYAVLDVMSYGVIIDDCHFYGFDTSTPGTYPTGAAIRFKQGGDTPAGSRGMGGRYGIISNCTIRKELAAKPINMAIHIMAPFVLIDNVQIIGDFTSGINIMQPFGHVNNCTFSGRMEETSTGSIGVGIAITANGNFDGINYPFETPAHSCSVTNCTFLHTDTGITTMANNTIITGNTFSFGVGNAAGKYCVESTSNSDWMICTNNDMRDASLTAPNTQKISVVVATRSHIIKDNLGTTSPSQRVVGNTFATQMFGVPTAGIYRFMSDWDGNDWTTARELLRINSVASSTHYIAVQPAVEAGTAIVSVVGGTSADASLRLQAKGAGSMIIGATTSKLGFFQATGAVKATVSGAKGGNAALTSLLTALAAYGLITDSST